ncbi:hypothetical protein KR222_004329, partial [Zaprionus bogoriensis]
CAVCCVLWNMAEVQECCNAFARDLFDVVARNSAGPGTAFGENAILSPVAIQTSLIFAFMGAAESTAEELREGLNLGAGDRKQVARCFHDFWTKHCRYGDSLILKSVNRLFVSEKLSLQTEFRDIAKEYFESMPEALRFTNSQQAVDRINKLVQQDTENKICDLLQPDAVGAETSAILINALYFKGKFAKPFTPESTMHDDFFGQANRRIAVDMMYQEDAFMYVELPELQARAVQLPYEHSDLSLLIILPVKLDGLLELERQLIAVDLRDIEERMTLEDVEIAMPRFTLQYDLDLKQTLQQLGISELFADSANLSGLFTTQTGHKISAAKHRGYIDVNEAGSEAAAVTFLKAVPMSLNMHKKTFKVDHPFAFFIRNKTAVFFAGRFVEPPK